MNSYKHSLKILVAYDDDNLIGIILVVGDGYSIIYIEDVFVLPKYQRKGIDSALISKIIYKYQNAYQIVLLTDIIEKILLFIKH